MADTIKCLCEHCGAKYRLPLEAQGRAAKCKRCGKKFHIPRQQSLEDSIMSWLAVNDDDDDAPAPPRVISMPKEDDAEAASRRVRGTIRMKTTPKEEEKTA